MARGEISSSNLIPPRPTLTALKNAALTCRACPLWKLGTQTVFGAGRKSARIVLIGEQPGNEEDLTGKPFVGPAGKLLDRALSQAGIDRSQAYLTNAVKHFKWERRGRRRIHKRPSTSEINACRPWLEAELRLLKPKVVVCLGATAAQTFFGNKFKVTHERGKFFETALAPVVMATVHPSSILRAYDDESRRAQMKMFVKDLKLAATKL
ncbi:MAG: uracil-DNA glycosylase [Acidobacteriota bacterium]|nr:uracil-DNA glycosylase [Acidobacteriota bacterium]